jgi:hypothetical protein
MSNNNSVLDGTKIDLSKITFSNIKQNENGSKSVRVSYNGGPLTIQTPMLHIPWNLNPPYSEKNTKKGGQKKGDNDNEADDDEQQQQQDAMQPGGRNKWSLQMSFRNMNDRKVKVFYDNMVALDALFEKKIVENRKEWFNDKTKYKDEQVAELVYNKFYKPGIREKVNKQDEPYPPCIEPKVSCENGEFRCNCFNLNREKYDKPMNKLQLKGTEGEGIIRLTNFYIQDSRCGPTWTLMRFRADESEGALGEFGFIDTTEDENDNSTQQNVQIHSDDENNDENNDNSATGDAEDDDDEPKPPTPPPAETKVVRKKRTVG